MADRLKRALKFSLSGEDTALDLRNIKYLPRWVVFLIDIFLVSVSTLLTILIILDLTPDYYTVLDFPLKAIFIVLVNIFFFFVFKTYAGIIRYSSNIDALKLLLATISSFITLVIFNYITYFVIGEKIYLVGGLLINLWISFSLLFLFRLTVKQVYEFFKIAQRDEELIRAVIIGEDENAISIAGALDIEHPRRFKIVGFLTKNKHNRSIRILDKPVSKYSSTIHNQVRALNAKAVILTEANLNSEEKFSLVEDCLENDIKVFNAPLVSSWEDMDKPLAQKVKTLQIEDLLDREPIVLEKQNKVEQLTGKTILVTGGAGSIGSEIVRQVAQYNPKKLIVLDQAETPLHNIQLEIVSKFPQLNYRCVICDVVNKKRLELLFKNDQIDVVYHAAAYKHVPLMEENPSEAVFVNISGTKNLADLSVKYQVGHFVMVSTDKAVNPSNVMGASKRAAEMYVQSLFHNQESANPTKFITTRFGNVLGSNGSVVPLFRKQIEKGGPVTITHPDIIRYFMTIPEACQLVLEAGAMGKGGEIFVFDMGEPVKIMDLAIKMIKLAGYIPNKHIKVKITGLRPGEKLYEELLNDECKTLPTHHKKIMIGLDNVQNYDSINDKVQKIIKSADKLKNDKVVAKLKLLIPEFISNNSSYQSLDKLMAQATSKAQRNIPD